MVTAASLTRSESTFFFFEDVDEAEEADEVEDADEGTFLVRLKDTAFGLPVLFCAACCIFGTGLR